MRKLVSFGDISLFMLLPFILSIGIGCNFFILEQSFKINLWHQLFIFAANNSLCKISMIILNCISTFLTKKPHKNTIIIHNPDYIQQQSFTSVYNELKKGALTKTIIVVLVILCSSLHYFYYILHFTFRFIRSLTLRPDKEIINVPSKYYGILIIIFQIIFLVPLNRLVFKIPIYKHQALALGMAVIGTFLYILKMFRDEGDYGMYYFLSGTILNCIEIVIEKYLMENKYITAFNLLFYEGCIEFFINIVMFFIFNSLFGNDGVIKIFDVVLMNFSELSLAFTRVGKCLLCLLGHFVVDFTIELSLMMTLYYLNPNFDYVAEIVSIFLVWIIEMIGLKPQNFFSSYTPEKLFGYFTLLLAAFIYNEIIILYFCGLERDTKKEIKKRAINLEQDEYISLVKQSNINDMSTSNINEL